MGPSGHELLRDTIPLRDHLSLSRPTRACELTLPNLSGCRDRSEQRTRPACVPRRSKLGPDSEFFAPTYVDSSCSPSSRSINRANAWPRNHFSRPSPFGDMALLTQLLGPAPIPESMPVSRLLVVTMAQIDHTVTLAAEPDLLRTHDGSLQLEVARWRD